MPDDPLLTTQQVAEYLGVPVATLYRWWYVGTGPRAIKVGRHCRVDPADLAEWVKNRKDQRATPPARGFGGGGGC